MAAPIVAVEIASSDAAPAWKQSLLDACSRAAEERCVEPQGEQQEPNVVAIVSWQDREHARLEVALRREQRWVAREMTFGDQDAPEERWRAVGLVIGTLASLMAHNKEPSPESLPHPAAAPPEPPPPSPPAPSSTEPPAPAERAPATPPPDSEIRRREETLPSARRWHKAWLDAAWITGSALDRGSVRMGAEVDGHLFLGEGVSALVGVSYSTALSRQGGVQTTFAEALVGLLYEAPLGRSFASALHAEAMGERLAPSLIDGSGGPSAGERWLGGARLGVDVTYWGVAPVGFFVGVAGKWRAAATDVRVGGQLAGTAPALGYVLRAGASFAFR